jgi:hypothetical protein
MPTPPSTATPDRYVLPDPGRLGLACLVYALFVVYGSLVPLDFHPRPLADAWAAVQQIPYLRLGITSRADWVANILLIYPARLSRRRRDRHGGPVVDAVIPRLGHRSRLLHRPRLPGRVRPAVLPAPHRLAQ